MELEFIRSLKRTNSVSSFIFKPNQPVDWTPGQYMDFEIPHKSPDSRGTHRWFTISSAPFEGNIMITTRISSATSTFKKALTSLRAGDFILSGLPRGDFVIEDASRHYIFIAGGIGITPFRSILLEYEHHNQPLYADLLYLDSNQEYVFQEELLTLAKKNKNFTMRQFNKRLARSDLDSYTGSADTVFYVSGPRGMVEAYQQTLEGIVDSERIKTDYFPGY